MSQFSIAVQNAMLDAFETVVGTAPILEMRTGAVPANCAAAASGTLCAQMTLPSDWMAGAGSASKAKSGTWADTSANNAGTIAHARLYDSGGSTCHWQGTVTAAGGGGDIELELVGGGTTVAVGQPVTVTAFTLGGGQT